MQNKDFQKIDIFLKINLVLILMRVVLSFTMRLFNFKLYLILYIILYAVVVLFLIIKYFFFYKTIKNNDLKIKKEDYAALFTEIFGRLVLLGAFIWLILINNPKDIYHNIPLWVGILFYIFGVKMFRKRLNIYTIETTINKPINKL